MYSVVLPPPTTTYSTVASPSSQDPVLGPADQGSIGSGFLDVEYKSPSTADTAAINVNKGNIGSFSVSNEGMEAGNPGAKVGISGEGDNERFYVGDKNAPHAIFGQLFSKTGVSEYGIWCDVGYFSGTVTASTFIGGSIHIPDEDTTANSFHTDTTGLSWWGATSTNKANAPVRIQPSGYMTLGDPAATHLQLDGPNVRMQSSNYSTGVAGFRISPDLIEAENLRARGAMNGVTFKYDVVSAVGGQLMVTNSDILDLDMTAADSSTLKILGNSTFGLNDILLMRGVTASGIQEEWMRVTNIASAPIYTVTRDLAAAYAANSNPVWQKGTPVVVQGKSDGAATYSGGWLRLLGQGTNSPYYSVYARTGIAYNNYTEIARFGNLNGIGSFAADTYGIFIGNYSSGQYLSYDTLSSSLNLNGYVARKIGSFGGDGGDGVVTDANLTIGGSDNTIITKNYTSWTAGSAARTLTITPKNCILVIKIKGDANFTNWNLDFAGKGPAGGGGGAAVATNGFTPQAGSAGTNPAYDGLGTLYRVTSGGSGGGGLTTAVGAGTNPAISAPARILPVVLEAMLAGKLIMAACGGAGGGGGSGSISIVAASASGAGGTGGAGGGCIIFEVGGNVTFSSTTASVAGANGAAGAAGTGSAFSGAGGGGGGGGGTFVLMYNGTLTGSLTPNVSGGSAGAGGSISSWGGAGDRIGAVGGAGGSSLTSSGNASVSTNAMAAGAAGAGATGQYLITQNIAFA